MSKLAAKAKKNRIRVFIIALTLLLMPMMGKYTPTTKAVPARGVHDYYSSSSFTTQVGSVTWLCNFTSCCSWGHKTNYVIYTPFDCDVDPIQ